MQSTAKAKKVLHQMCKIRSSSIFLCGSCVNRVSFIQVAGIYTVRYVEKTDDKVYKTWLIEEKWLYCPLFFC